MSLLMGSTSIITDCSIYFTLSFDRRLENFFIETHDSVTIETTYDVVEKFVNEMLDKYGIVPSEYLTRGVIELDYEHTNILVHVHDSFNYEDYTDQYFEVNEFNYIVK